MKIYDLSQPLERAVSVLALLSAVRGEVHQAQGRARRQRAVHHDVESHGHAPRRAAPLRDQRHDDRRDSGRVAVRPRRASWICRDEMDELELYTPKMIEDRVEGEEGRPAVPAHRLAQVRRSSAPSRTRRRYIHRHPGAHPDMVPWLLEEGDPHLGRRLRLDRPSDEPADRPLPRQGHARPLRSRAQAGRGEVRRARRRSTSCFPTRPISSRTTRSSRRTACTSRTSAATSTRRSCRTSGSSSAASRGSSRAARRRSAARWRSSGDWEAVSRPCADLTGDASSRRRRVGDRGELSRAVRREVVEACLARVDALNRELNAIVTLEPARARRCARRSIGASARGETPGLLCGLSGRHQGRDAGRRAADDVRFAASTPTTCRTRTRSSCSGCATPARSSSARRTVRSSPPAATRSTRCSAARGIRGIPTKSAGGSTGGGAAALATGMIALAEGTDLGGSLRIPASFCGVVGLRPSVGLVPTQPTDWVWDTLQVDRARWRARRKTWR